MKKLILPLLLLFTLASNAQVSNTYADSLFNKADYNKALDAYYDNYQIDNKNFHAVSRLAFIYSLMEGTAYQAEIWYKKAIAINPNDAKLNYEYAMFILDESERLKPDLRAKEKQRAKQLLLLASQKGFTEAKEELKKLQ